MTDLEDHEGTVDSKSKREMRDDEGDYSRSKGRERGKRRDKDRERDSEVSVRRRDIDRDSEVSGRRRSEKETLKSLDRFSRKRHGRSRRSPSPPKYSFNRRSESRSRSPSKSFSSKRYGRSCRSHSQPKYRTKRRSRSRSPSPSKRKRVSGFDISGPLRFSNHLVPCTFPQPVKWGLPVVPIGSLKLEATRPARRIYVGGLPSSVTAKSLADHFSEVMATVGGKTVAEKGDAVANVYVNHEKKFAYLEMRTVEEASNAMALDGIIYEGVPLQVRRPSDYNRYLAAFLGPSQARPHLDLAAVKLKRESGIGGSDYVFVYELPLYLPEAQVRDLLETFGTLKCFCLVEDQDSGNSKGWAFFKYQDVTVTNTACNALNGLVMGESKLVVNVGPVKPELKSEFHYAQQQIALEIALENSHRISLKIARELQQMTRHPLEERNTGEDPLNI